MTVSRRVTFPQQPDRRPKPVWPQLSSLSALDKTHRRAAELALSSITARHSSSPCRHHTSAPCALQAPQRFVSKSERRVHGEAATGASASFESD